MTPAQFRDFHAQIVLGLRSTDLQDRV
jgi:hypothetical protein